jgi:3-phosphoshikimate 1-carboxyvinyltransferase
MGARISGHGNRVTAPLTITGARLSGIEYHVPMASAQVKSAILFAGLFAAGPTVIREDVRTRSTTEDMLMKSGVTINVEQDNADPGRTVRLVPGRPLAQAWEVPGDPSQAAFFAVLGAIHADASIEVTNVEGSPERNGYLGVLDRMGARLHVERDGDTLRFLASSSVLVGTEVQANDIPSVDEVPVLVVAAAAATGTTAFRNVGELRHKESDRFAGSMELAANLGCRTWSDGDDFFVEGVQSATRFDDFTLPPSLDHRMVMASAVAGLAGAGCTLRSVDTVATSYPQFFRDVELLSE